MDRPVLEYQKPMIGGGVANGYDPAIKKDGTILDDGYIALQAESQPVEFRNVRLLNLSGCMDPVVAGVSHVFRASRRYEVHPAELKFGPTRCQDPWGRASALHSTAARTRRRCRPTARPTCRRRRR